MTLIACPECGIPVSEKASACPRCGAPISSGTPTSSPAQPQASASVQRSEIRGVGGWLNLFGLGCFLGGFASLSGLSEWDMPASDWEAVRAAIPWVSGLRVFSVVYAVAAAAGVWWLLYLLIRPRTTTALWAVVVLATASILGAIGWLWAEQFLSQLGSLLSASGEQLPASDVSDVRSAAARGVIGPLVWVWYFFRSKRVRNTFGEVSISRIRAWIGGRVPATPIARS